MNRAEFKERVEQCINTLEHYQDKIRYAYDLLFQTGRFKDTIPREKEREVNPLEHERAIVSNDN